MNVRQVAGQPELIEFPFSPDSPQRPRTGLRGSCPWLWTRSECLIGSIAQSQSRRLKMRYRLTQTTAINPIAKGYPKAQCSSGISSKFMP